MGTHLSSDWSPVLITWIMKDVERRSRRGSKQSPGVWRFLKHLLTYWKSHIYRYLLLFSQFQQTLNLNIHSTQTHLQMAPCNVLLFQKLMTVTIHTQPIWWSLGLLHLAVYLSLHILSICGTLTLKTVNLGWTWQYIMGGMTSVPLDLKIYVFYLTAWANNVINYGYKHLQIARIARVYYKEVKKLHLLDFLTSILQYNKYKSLPCIWVICW